MPSKPLLLLVRFGLLVACLLTVALGLAMQDFHIKVLVSAAGGTLVGFIGALAFRMAAKIEPAKVAQVSENVREAQRILNEMSISRQLGMQSAPAIDPSSLNLMEMLRQPLFMFVCAVIGIMVWFSPSFYDSTAIPWSAITARGVGAHILAMLFIAFAVLGIICKISSGARVAH